jgi:hypothetical protein
MASNRRRTLLWWKFLAIVIAVGLGYAGFVAYHWDRFMEWGADANKEFTEKDLLQCEPGTHQEKGRCVSNPNPSHPAPAPVSPAPAPAPPAQK